jgi:hypothetical protein
MGVTYCNLKPIVKGSEHYHEIRWNVQFLLATCQLAPASPAA